MANTPVLFLIFNRPDTTKLVFDAIKKAKPTKLYIASDGPRESKKNEVSLCLESRSIVSQIDWNCEVKTLFRENNLGCKLAVSSAIDWFFQFEDEGIILEDDVLPCDVFFDFCGEMLNKYRDDSRIAMVTGNNLLGGGVISNEYYFSNFYSIWGWATWKRSWNTYDVNISLWPDTKLKSYLNFKYGIKLAQYFESSFDLIKSNSIDTWDHQWTYNCVVNSGFCITPRANLITNIGVLGAHSLGLSENHFVPFGFLDLFNLCDPRYVIVDHEADAIFVKSKIKNLHPIKELIVKILKKLSLYIFVKKYYKKIS